MDIFPNHFMFELTKKENEFLRSQIVTSKKEEVAQGIYQWHLQSMESYSYHMLLEVKKLD